MDELGHGAEIGPFVGRVGAAAADAEAINRGQGRGNKRDVTGAAGARVVGGDGRKTKITAHGIKLREDGTVGGGIGHGGVALAEGDRRGGAGEIFGDDGAHLGLGLGELLGADGAEVAADEGALGGDVGLAGDMAAGAVEGRLGAANDEGGVEGEAVEFA